MKVNRISKKVIKPSTPTPDNLKKYKLSLLDELSPSMNLTILLFYPSMSKKANLEESLSTTLSQFYPLSGRYIRRDHLVDCSDQGVEFVKAEAVGARLSDLIGKSSTDQISDLLPSHDDLLQGDGAPPLVLIQVTGFESGGVVIGISVSHRISDAPSVGMFVSSWSNTCKNINNPGDQDEVMIRPTFDSCLLFPGKNVVDHGPDSEIMDVINIGLTLKRFLFAKESISRLKSRVGITTDEYDRSGAGAVAVVVVFALIAKALIRLERAKNGGATRRCLVVQPTNIRERTTPCVAKHCFGNLAIPCLSESDTKGMGVKELVHVLDDAIDKTMDEFSEILSVGGEGLDRIIVDRVANAMEKTMSGEVGVSWGGMKLISGGGSPVGPESGRCRLRS